IITKGGFQVDIQLETANGDKIVDIKGLATKHFINYDSDGLPINSKNVHVNISEKDLTDLGYIVRNAKHEVALLNHKVRFKDSTDVVRSYKVSENYPDETLGLIVCILTSFTE
ncbi:hypothetical protein, partial [Tenacibaculum finnmarkense]|uniref:hypothetical protein n=1 Tax=Tenacibaculum finnmarkense TaxID=2781243 RepID=UPI00207AF9DF